ncbi:hypothetical protein [Vibrio coralliilyticus]|uniref:hypothetical protein n=1 Tax=Vibrio coralliilyticus TaxID=190893 RepID=UPI001E34BED7|nr:hypothetical protein [Vibrio coralliilyticus]MCC2525771.1 hypothetical protein [Vibrio coralliilyticus]
MKKFFISMLLTVSASSSAADVATVYEPSLPWLDALVASPLAGVYWLICLWIISVPQAWALSRLGK